MQFIYTNGENPDFIELCRGLDDFLNELVGGEENRAEYVPYNRLSDIHDAIIAYDGEIPVGCAAFKKYDDEFAEVKRVFIKQEFRGKGISRELMKRLENAAKEQGFRCLILESGEPLVAAMSLYRKIGYEVIPNYGQYKDMPDSVCMKKEF
ncbi:MAG: GNAT family N-acetyltransferase [Treponemataceae bacterium]|nr:GNAT family N-acetyltransferase [Treponemataceae bacterium]